jgi:DNA-binding response OmpR family regulator
MAPLEQKSGDSAPGPFTRKSRYILVVEGNTSDLFYTAMLLQRFSYPVCTARNARQALDMVSVALPALVIADSDLPGMTGMDLMRVLGSNTHTFSLPVIVLLPPGGTGPEKQDVEIGGSYFLQKPVAIEDLYRSVQAAMEPRPRSTIRVETALPVKVNNVALDSERGECVTNLSAQGVYIRTFKHYHPNEHVAVKITIEGHTVNSEGTILYTRRQGDGPLAEPGMAVKFTRIAEEDRELIKRFIHNEVTSGIVTEEP